MPSVDFQSFVDEVIAKNDICEVVSEYAKLKRVGNRFSALCPLHNDKKSPSLSISPDKQLFHCFGCGAGGNVIHFIMGVEHIDFMDALKYLAERAKMTMPDFSSGGAKETASGDKKKLIYTINSEAARYFYSNLASEKGREAYAYLKNRGIKNSTIKMFGIGYAPEGWTSLIDFLKAKGYKEHDIYEAGLAKMRDNGTYYDAFYDGRVMFPIINVQGNVIGFGGRIMTEKSNTGKYLNSPETIVFKKKENLFGLNLAKNNRSGRLLLMEGYMDVISLHQAGITNAVASLGTAFTEEQARLVKRYGGKAVLCYDSDEAGKKATLRAGEILTAQGIKTKVLTVTDGKDPDEFVRSKGGDMFNVLIEGAKPLFEYRIEEILKEYNPNELGKPQFADSEQMIEFAEKAARILAEINNPLEYEVYAKKIAADTDISVDTINAVAADLKRKHRSDEERAMERRSMRQKESFGQEGERVCRAERLILSLICEKKVYRYARAGGLLTEHFSEELHRRLAEIIEKEYEANDILDINRVLSFFDDRQRGEVSKILLDDKNIQDKEKACGQALEIIFENINRQQQQTMLDSGNLKQLDELLKKSAKHNKSRNGGTF